MNSIFARTSCALLLAGMMACASQPEAPAVVSEFRTMQTGEKAPPFSAVDIGGTSHSVGPAQPVTLLNMWATWCGPCIDEFPDLQQIHDDLGPSGLRVLGMSVDDIDPEAIRVFGQRLSVTFPLLMDPSGTLQDQYRAGAVPSTFLIDADGLIVQSWTGRLPSSAHQEIVNYLNTTTP